MHGWQPGEKIGSENKPGIEAACGTWSLLGETVARMSAEFVGGLVASPVVRATFREPSGMGGPEMGGCSGGIPQVSVEDADVFDVNTGPTPPAPASSCVICPV